MIKQVTIVTTDEDGDRHPSEGFCWTADKDPLVDAATFCVFFGVPTWSVEAMTA